MATLAERIRHRAAAAGEDVADETLARLVVYLDLLSFWNRRMNLTAFDLSVVRDEAIDRLLVEPLAAVRLIRAGDRRALDIGSGGGSPAAPIAIALPAIEMMMVEVRARKGAFLREVVRTLGLRATVEVCRAEEVAARAGAAFDLVTFRAVRADGGFWGMVDALLVPGGRVLWFGGFGHKAEIEMFRSVDFTGGTVALERVSS